MKATVNFVAIDLGASSGRLVVGCWDGERFHTEELHRFPNGSVQKEEHLHWDVARLWSEIKCGLGKYGARYGEAPAGIAVDAWGVDYALLDATGRLIGDPYHYRDSRTDGVPAQVFARVPERAIYEQTGIQTMQINTLFQLFSMVGKPTSGEGGQKWGTNHLESAEQLLMIPDLFNYWLCGEKAVEYTEASTTQMLLCRERRWADELLCRLEIPAEILGRIVYPGTALGDVSSEVLAECGLSGRIPVIAVGSHDTASAVAAVPFMDEQSLFISSGTWSLMGVESKEPITSEQAFRLNVTNEGGVNGEILLLKNIAGLWLLQECVRRWETEGRAYKWDELIGLAGEAEPFRSVVDVDASEFLAPENMPFAIREYCRRAGQPFPETDGALARCCLEGLALKYRKVLESLESLTGRELKTIRIVGGGSQNALLCHMAADVCQREVVAGPVEASCLGNVMVQAVATGHLESIGAGRTKLAGSVSSKSYGPRMSAAEADEAYAKFCSVLGM